MIHLDVARLIPWAPWAALAVGIFLKYLDLRQHAVDVSREFIEEAAKSKPQEYQYLIDKLREECKRTGEIYETERVRRRLAEDENEVLRGQMFRVRQMVRHIISVRMEGDNKDITALMNVLREDDEVKEIVKIAKNETR